MRFLSLIKSSENIGPVPQAFLDAMEKASAETEGIGTLLDGGGLAPSARSESSASAATSAA